MTNATCLRAHPSVVLLVKKLTGFVKSRDWVINDELDIEVCMLKEGSILSCDSQSSEKFKHSVKVLTVRN